MKWGIIFFQKRSIHSIPDAYNSSLSESISLDHTSSKGSEEEFFDAVEDQVVHHAGNLLHSSILVLVSLAFPTLGQELDV